MSLIFRFPTNVSLDQAVQEYVVQRALLKGDKIMPLREHMTQRVQWDELDAERGMTAAHNMKTDPRIDTRPGSKTREYTPIPFKETDVINEDELLQARAFATLGGVADLGEVVGRVTRAREDKTFIRMESLRWQALQGAISVNENGVVVNETFPVQSYNAITAWSNRATATPLRDFNSIILLFSGTGASGEGATAYMNRATFNNLLENSNQADIAGFRGDNFRNIAFSLTDLNKILENRGLPIIEVYDEGYIDRAGAFVKYIPDNTVIVIGKRPMGQVIGDFSSTPSLHRMRNGVSIPGMFSIIEVNGQSNRGMAEVSLADLGAGKNPRIEITGGIYGGPRILYPRSVVKMSV